MSSVSFSETVGMVAELYALFRSFCDIALGVYFPPLTRVSLHSHARPFPS
jgi:hypothetical protein